MNIKNILIVLLLAANHTYSQTSIVRDGSFEILDTCLGNFGSNDLSLLTHWTQINGRPAALNDCSLDGFLRDTNLWGIQPYHSGNGYVFMTSLVDKDLGPGSDTVLIDIMQGVLDFPLTAGIKYEVGIWISLTETSQFTAKEPFQFRLQSNPEPIPFYQFGNFNCDADGIFDGFMIQDKNTWYYSADSYEAAGGEKYILIGNFCRPSLMQIEPVLGGVTKEASYYIDDAVVIPPTGTGIEPPVKHAIQYPDRFELDRERDYRIISAAGVVVMAGRSQVVDIQGLPCGVYFLRVNNTGFVRKFVTY